MEEKTQISVLFTIVILLTLALFYSFWYASHDRVNYCKAYGGEVVAANGKIQCVFPSTLPYCRDSSGKIIQVKGVNMTGWKP